MGGRWVRRLLTALRNHPTAADLWLALLFTASALVSALAAYAAARSLDPAGLLPMPSTVIVSMVAITLPLTWRRRFPLSTAAVVVIAYLLATAVRARESPVTVLAGSLALYSAAAHGDRRRRTVVLSLALGAILTVVGYEIFFTTAQLPGQLFVRWFILAFNAAVLALPWALGAAMRSLRERERELTERAAELQRERESNARQAVFHERVRIARELHDVVAHHVSVMGVQAGAARRVMGRWPDKATEALRSVEASSRQAVQELQQLVSFLRRGDEASKPASQPRLGQLDDLIDQVSKSGLSVDLNVEGDSRPLAPMLEVSAYRIIQEALTNTLKHADAATVTVRIRYRPSALEIDVLDDGTATPDLTGETLGGHGLIGMRERASLHGGRLQADRHPQGGFAVHAILPLNGFIQL